MIYSYNSQNNSFKINFTDTYFLIVDSFQLVLILNKNKNWIFDETETYPYYNKNSKKILLINLLFKFNQKNVKYEFRNDNILDIRKENVIPVHNYNNIIRKNFNIVNYYPRKCDIQGKDAGIMKNPIWLTKDNKYLMYCEPETLCILCKESIKRVREYENKENVYIFWTKNKLGEIVNNKKVLIQQVILNFYKSNKFQKISHIDDNLLNNRVENLRISTIKNKILSKRNRKKTAKKLPKGLKNSMIPKYVVYYNEIYNDNFREYFRIEGHPKLDKIYSGSKSKKFNIFQKLQLIKNKLKELDSSEIIEKPKLPQYISISNIREKTYLVFDKKTDKKRYTLKMKLTDFNIDEEVKRLKKKVKKKFKIEF